VLDPIDRATPDPDFPICSSDCWLRVSMHSVGPAIGDLDKGILGFSLSFFLQILRWFLSLTAFFLGILRWFLSSTVFFF
jgi:hypothetical protein